jgi:hypothetical protein
MDPVDVYAKVPIREALEHPLSWAVAVGATLKARAVTAAIVKVFAMVLPFMTSLLCDALIRLPVRIRLTCHE